MPDGRAVFSVCDLPEHALDSDEYMLMTIRSHDQYNTTIYGLDDRYRGIYNERRVILMNRSDMADRGFKDRDLVNLNSTYGGQVRHARQFHVVGYDMPKGDIAGYFPELNSLVPIDQYADESRTPISKSIKVRISLTS